jgi:hypothetical protein
LAGIRSDADREASNTTTSIANFGASKQSSLRDPNMESFPMFDCFLSHNSRDKPAVRALAEALRARGISVWLDEEQLRPGVPWQPLLESGIRASRSVVVLVGADGLGPWESEEMRAALSLAVRDKRPAIPTLLADAPAQPELPLFLQERTWVDLRSQVVPSGVSALDCLVWGITGKAPQRADPSAPPEVSGQSVDRNRNTSGVGLIAAPPVVVSIWSGENKQGFLNSGLLLDSDHVLTVKRTFNDWAENLPVYVRLIDGVDGDVVAYVFQRHRERDAAILKLSSAVGPIASPHLHRGSSVPVPDGEQAALRFIDPGTHSRTPPVSCSIASFDHVTGEYVLAPENARGSSGGVVEVRGQVVGLLSRRKTSDPLCRAVAIHLIASWIDVCLRSGEHPPPEPERSSPEPTLDPAYRDLLASVRKRVRDLLSGGSVSDLTLHWGSDPIAALAAEPAADRIPGQIAAHLDDLYKATRACSTAWRARPEEARRAIKKDCRALLSELTKLAVNRRLSPSDLADVAAAPPERLHLACQFGGTGDLVYCALADLPHLLAKGSEDRGVESELSVHLDERLPSGLGEDLRQEIMRKLWTLVMPDPLPGRIDGKDLERLRSRIARHRDRDGRRYLLVAPGPREFCEEGDYRRWTDSLRLGLVLYENGRCQHLLLDEAEVIDRVREYLELVECL